MLFTVLEREAQLPDNVRSQAFLIKCHWSDYGYIVMFNLVFCDSEGIAHDIGQVKISHFEADSPDSAVVAVEVPETFSLLGNQFFSLGQDDTYYSNLRQQGVEVCEAILRSLRDMAYDLDLFRRARIEQVTHVSLLRCVEQATVERQFHRITQGGPRLSPFTVTYTGPTVAGSEIPIEPLMLSFKVVPHSQPSTNIHVLTGRNNAGTSYLLHRFTRCVMDPTASSADVGGFTELGKDSNHPFSNMIAVTFSAFDLFFALPHSQSFPYTYIGLKIDADPSSRGMIVKSLDDLAHEFAESAEACVTGATGRRWAQALETLSCSSSGFFKDDAWLVDFQNDEDDKSRKEKARNFFSDLSSDHKIVLLTITRLVEKVTERSLILIDEPECHLHPPLLAAFIRALSNLLADRNGIAIIATHSPVVVQEVPAHCVWKIHRNGDIFSTDRPVMETFGENIGVLTHEVFGLEVTDSAFFRELEKAVKTGMPYEQVLHYFEGHLGGEGKAIARALIAVRETRGTSCGQ